MDRSYLLSCSKTNLNDVCISHFRNIIYEDPSLESKIVNGACELVSRDRRQGDADRGVLQEGINMFHALATYSNSFEPRLLAASQHFVSSWSEETSQTNELTAYVKATQQNGRS